MTVDWLTTLRGWLLPSSGRRRQLRRCRPQQSIRGLAWRGPNGRPDVGAQQPALFHSLFHVAEVEVRIFDDPESVAERVSHASDFDSSADVLYLLAYGCSERNQPV